MSQGSAEAERATRVMVVDDHAIARWGLRVLLEAGDGIAVVGEAAGADEAIEQAGRLTPDVIVLDAEMPGTRPADILPRLLELAPVPAVIVLSSDVDRGYMREALGAGARGYLLKEAADAELVPAVAEVASGRRYVQADLR